MGLNGQEQMGAVMVLMVVWGGACMAQSSSTCTNTIMGLASCLNFVTGNASTPSPVCCLQLSTVVQTHPRCLCSLLMSSNVPNIGITINQTLAVTLPDACRIHTPPINLCNGGAASAPANTPTGDETPTLGAPKLGSKANGRAPSFFLFIFLLLISLE